jgi:replicative DNA helicase
MTNRADVGQFANSDAERAVLGAILVDERGDQLDIAVGLGLAVEDFSVSAHREIFKVCSELWGTGQSLDLVSVVNELANAGRLEPVGGAAYVSSLLDGAPDRASLKGPAKIVLEKSAKRKTATACEAARASLETGESSRTVIGTLEERLLSIQAGTDGAAILPVATYTDAMLNEWLKLAESDQDLLGLSTGIDSIDVATCGMCPGELWLCGGRTGDGKSSLALQAVAANCRNSIPVGVFSFELSRKEILHRLWVGESNTPYQGIRKPKTISAEKRSDIARSACDVGRWPLYIEDNSALNISQLTARARLMIRQHRVKLLVVDYVQLISAVAQNDRKRITKVSNSLRTLAKDTGVPVLAISQLARPRDGDENARPNKHSLKESGALENDSHTIVLIYRPKEHNGEHSGEDELIIAKQRNGMTGSEPVYFDPRTLTFRLRYLGRKEGQGVSR